MVYAKKKGAQRLPQNMAFLCRSHLWAWLKLLLQRFGAQNALNLRDIAQGENFVNKKQFYFSECFSTSAGLPEAA